MGGVAARWIFGRSANTLITGWEKDQRENEGGKDGEIRSRMGTCCRSSNYDKEIVEEKNGFENLWREGRKKKRGKGRKIRAGKETDRRVGLEGRATSIKTDTGNHQRERKMSHILTAAP